MRRRRGGARRRPRWRRRGGRAPSYPLTNPLTHRDRTLITSPAHAASIPVSETSPDMSRSCIVLIVKSQMQSSSLCSPPLHLPPPTGARAALRRAGDRAAGRPPGRGDGGRGAAVARGGRGAQGPVGGAQGACACEHLVHSRRCTHAGVWERNCTLTPLAAAACAARYQRRAP